MAGTWLSVVQGFGGFRIRDNKVVLNPFLPKEWKAYSFHIVFRNTRMKIKINENGLVVEHLGGPDCMLMIKEKEYTLKENSKINV